MRWMAPEVVSPPIFSSESDESDIQEASDPYKVTLASDVHSFGMTVLEVRSLIQNTSLAFLNLALLALNSPSSFRTS